MNSNERRLKILYMLQSGKRITSSSLTEWFGISKRTVFRDLKVIQELGVPITHDSEMGYGVLRDGMIPPIMFSFRELSVVIMGLSFVSSQVDKEMVMDAKNIILKIRNAVPASLQKAMNILEEKTLVSPYIHNVEKRESGGDWFILCSAFLENKPVTFFYKNKKGKSSLRKIDPCLLIHYTDHWNVIGYCHDRKSLRNFILSGMDNLSLADDSNQISNKRYSTRELLYGRSESLIPVTVSISNEQLFSFLTGLPGEIQNKSDGDDNSTIVTFTIDNLDYINEWLLRFGKHVRIISPDELKEMRTTLLKMLLDDRS